MHWFAHKGSPISSISALLCILIDMIYFAVLFYVYYRSMKHDRFLAVQGFLLVAIACVCLWMNMIGNAFQFDFRWYFDVLDVFTDDICLFLMFSCPFVQTTRPNFFGQNKYFQHHGYEVQQAAN
jgi:hypothetical protein